MVAPIAINVKADVREFTRALTRIQKRQIPFATSKALNDTASFAAVNLADDTRKYFQSPTPFTQKAFAVKRSSKRNLSAEVFAKPAQDAYLRYQVEGGTRRPQGRALVLPSGVRLNRYGNIPRGRIKRLLSRADTFSGSVRGVAGIWQRNKVGGLKLLVAYESIARYSERYPFDTLFKRYANRGFNVFFERALQSALRTAR